MKKEIDRLYSIPCKRKKANKFILRKFFPGKNSYENCVAYLLILKTSSNIQLSIAAVIQSHSLFSQSDVYFGKLQQYSKAQNQLLTNELYVYGWGREELRQALCM